MKSIYVIGSLRNPEIVSFTNDLEKLGLEVFSDWFCPGDDADDCWKKYYQARGKTYKEAINGPMAHCIFNFDKSHLDRTDAAVLLKPAGQSAAYELGYTIGKGKPGFIVYPKEPEQNERWEVMARFATEIFFSRKSFLKYLKDTYIKPKTKTALSASFLRCTQCLTIGGHTKYCPVKKDNYLVLAECPHGWMDFCSICKLEK